ncbi:MAG: hypothetical protein ACO33Y_07310, partial [Burkholderiaceae bacterium]
QETLSVLARADEALGLSPGSTQSELAKRTAKTSTIAAVDDVSETANEGLSFSATMAPLRKAGSSSKEEPQLSGALDDEPPPALAADARQPATAKKKFPAILVVGILALGASALLTLIQRLPEMGGESPVVAPAGVLQPPAVVNPSATTALPETPASASPEGVPTQSSNAPEQPAAPPSAVPEQPAVAAASPQAPAASTAPSPAAPVAPATPAGQRQFIVKGPLPERQETDPAVRLAPNTVNSAASTPSPPPPTARVAPTPAAPAAAAPSRGGVARPEILTDLTAGFYVQHIASPSRGNVEVFWRSRPVLRQARLLELRRAPGSQSPNFVLVSGPFESMEQAQRFMAQPGLPRDMWLREASKIRPLLPNP